MQNYIPRILLAGLSGGTGKTIVSLALVRAFSRAGKTVAPFKKGPDYIDAQWLGLAADRPCSNLDPFFHTRDGIRSVFFHKSLGAGISIIEGNRGLFDGMDEHGTCSSAELARMLEAPVILVIDCTKMTRTTAAIVKGCAAFEPGLNLAGVILNRTAGERHRSVLQKSLEAHTDIPVLGMLPKIGNNPIPERHMGLMSDQEYDGSTHLDALADMAEEWLDLDAVEQVARSAPDFGPNPPTIFPGLAAEKSVRIGYVHDAALWFYYPENLEALEHAGAELVRLSILSDEPWPEIDGLYLGGGFPEVFAERIADNRSILDKLRSLSEAGLPIYAECGGFMVLCDSLEMDGSAHRMAGIFPLGTSFCPRPQGLGYTEGVVVEDTVFFPKGARLLGHEFHYSMCVSENAARLHRGLKMVRGQGSAHGHDGFIYKNTWAGYNHIHALAIPGWAENFVHAAQIWRTAGQQ
ncbi:MULTISPECIES: cobyrinate a,c-diamide synthase [unclassified Pseudodesulfovibrio]|uniref:cobyrinate a,c-diamide synthase n=1 Tax=unclassified Pseudodesulfovibrio TaxID=2661612 RepID=UPI000FEB8141|nr:MULTISPECIES: cobyrinate a,c-diamide synthase [unclassified Pseudodesulfovibrio]MCJ2164323.1 cobyrinate a,c-diamide synthase [Pseudodesulfovibrio sp. S3-i]RWU04533.1 cobyrinate a,c-diamide synthase [Pseudodesulfovibrio sp. S3]